MRKVLIDFYFPPLMRRTLTAMLFGLSLMGCDPREYRTETSALLHEEALVTKRVKTPAKHDIDIVPTIDFEGNIGIGIDVDDIPEKYAVIFKCQHGEFIIQGSENRYQSLYDRLNEGDEVDVLYREVYKAVYDRSKAEKELIEKRLVKYDFIDAEKKN